MKRLTGWTGVVVLMALGACNKAEDESSAADATGEAVAAEATEVGGYPLTVCVVSGEDLGSMGEPVVYNHEGTTVKFCCSACIDEFKADPAKYLAKLEGGAEPGS